MIDQPSLDEPTEWGVGHAIGVFLVAQVLSFVGLFAFAAVTGIESQAEFDDLTIGETAVLQIPLWVGLIGGSTYVAIRWGRGVVAGLGFRVRGSDAPLGLVIGLACQLILVPLVSFPFLVLFDVDRDEVSRPAQELADKATGSGVVILALVVVVGAPLAEELFFRGLLQRALARRVGPALTVACTTITFGLSHFQLLQFPALAAFGVVLSLLVVWRGDLGLSIWTHVGFNATTVAFLVLT